MSTCLCTACNKIIYSSDFPTFYSDKTDGEMYSFLEERLKKDKVPCPYCKTAGMVVPVDENIVDTIQLMNKKGYKTRYCCEGHRQYFSDGDEASYSNFYIVFMLPPRWVSVDWFFRMVQPQDYLSCTIHYPYNEDMSLRENQMWVRVESLAYLTRDDEPTEEEFYRKFMMYNTTARTAFSRIVKALPDTTKTTIPLFDRTGRINKDLVNSSQ